MMACDCRISLPVTEKVGGVLWPRGELPAGYIIYCPRHDAADAMYVALENALAELTKGTQVGRLRAMVLLGNAIALADGDKDGE